MTSNGCEFLNEEAKQYLNDLSEKIRRNQVILFVGAGLSRTAQRKDGKFGCQIPLWSDLTEKMLERIYGKDYEHLKREKYDYLNVVDKFEAVFGRVSLIQFIKDSLEDLEFEPGRIHQLISRFNWEILTTNFDTLIERGYELTKKTPNLIIYDSDLSNTERPRIFKINGCIKHAPTRELIISGEDFRTFSEKKPIIELYVKKCFIESTILFVGFSMNDPAFKMIHGWVRDHLLEARANRFAYSIQFFVDQSTKKMWESRGIHLIELFPEGSTDDQLAEKRLHSLFFELYQRQIGNEKIKEYWDKNDKQTTRDRLEVLEKNLDNLEQEFKNDEDMGALQSKTVQDRLGSQLLECLKVFLNELFSQLGRDNKTGKLNKDDDEKEVKLWMKFLDSVQKYLCKGKKENILFQFLKEIIAKLEETEGKLFALEKVPGYINIMFERFLMKTKTEFNNPNIWIMAIYMGLRIGSFQELLPVNFFKKGFKIIRQTASTGDSEHRVAKDLHRYWLFSLMFIGPFKCAETFLDINRKILPLQYPWDISEYLHYHLEVFFGDRFKNGDLFLRTFNKLRTSNETEAFYKFLLLDTFLQEFGFNDLFLNRTYQELSGQFRSEMSQYRNILSRISFPVKKSYFKSVMQTVFEVIDKGKSFMFTGLSDIILSFPKITIEERDIKELKKSSLVELILLAILYDKPVKGRAKEKELRNLITTTIDSEVIDKSNFLRLLLFRLEETNLENMEQNVDNGLSRYLTGLVSFILCALPYLEKEDLLEIKKTIETHLPHVKINEIREDMIRIVGYISDQLPEEDFTIFFKTIFSLAIGDHYCSLGLKFLNIPSRESDLKKIKIYSKLRFIFVENLEKQGTPFDRDFIDFMLNHKKEELFPDEDTHLKRELKKYFDIRTEIPEHLSWQWLMDLQQFIDKGFIQLDNDMAKRVENFIDTAFEIPGVIREWKLKIFEGKMIKVYSDFAHLFKDQVVSKIIESYRKDMKEQEVKLNELDPEVQDNFAHLFKEIYKSKYHNTLNDAILQNIKEFIEEGLAGGGYLGAFWEHLNKKEKTQLTGIMLDLWLPESEESILRAVKATGEFLKYKTDEEAMKELTNRLLYCIFSGSTPVKIQWCKVVAAHVNHVIEKSLWFTENEKKILDCLNLFKMEKNLELLRKFLELARLFKMEEVKETIDYLKDNAPYAETRRAAERFAPVSSK